MLIKHAILGMLSIGPRTGYDLKKTMQGLPFMYWSGNNNQIYKTLMELRDDGLVTGEVRYGETSPTKKVYTVTSEGLEELKHLSLSLPEIPETKKTFLVQLAFSGQLSGEQLKSLLVQYRREVNGQLLYWQSAKKDSPLSSGRTPRECAIWELVYDNLMNDYENELAWTDRVLQMIDAYPDESTGSDTQKERKAMKYQVVERNGQKYIRLDPAETRIQFEQDGIELVSLCAENGTNLLMIPGDCFSAEFLRLSTGVAGAVLQKLGNVKTVAVLDAEKVKGRFKDFLIESNRGSLFRSYENPEEAEQWLLSGRGKIN